MVSEKPLRLTSDFPVASTTSSQFVVPNVVHFIWFAIDANKELTFVNYVSIISAHRIQKPDAILLHCNHLPAGPWWLRLWKEVI